MDNSIPLKTQQQDLLSFPLSLLAYVLSFTDAKDMLPVKLTCKKFLQAASSSVYYINILTSLCIDRTNKYFVPDYVIVPKLWQGDWKRIFMLKTPKPSDFVFSTKQKREDELGTIFYSHTVFYEGEMTHNLVLSRGILYISHGGTYHVRLNVPNFTGRGWIADAVSFYYGDIHNGKKEGEGTAYFTDRRIYKGAWVDGRRKGWGIERGDHCFYEGNWENGLMNGMGRYTDRTGGTYHGHFVNGEKDGLGELVSKNGHKYVGGFKRDRKHGAGVLYGPNGNALCISRFKNGLPSGRSVVYHDSGATYHGFLQRGKPNGVGSIYTKDLTLHLHAFFLDGKITRLFYHNKTLGPVSWPFEKLVIRAIKKISR